MTDRYFVRKYEGDDDLSWAVFRNLPPRLRRLKIVTADFHVHPVVCGLSRREADYYRNKFTEETRR